MQELASAIRLSCSTCQQELMQAQEVVTRLKNSNEFDQICISLIENYSAFNLEPQHVFAVVIQLRLWVKDENNLKGAKELTAFSEKLIVLAHSALNIQILKLIAETLALVIIHIDTPTLCTLISRHIETLSANSSATFTEDTYFKEPLPVGNATTNSAYIQKLASIYVLTTVIARFRTVTNNRNRLDQILSADCLAGLLKNIRTAGSFVARSAADYAFQYSLMIFTYSFSPIVVTTVCRQIEEVYYTIHKAFEHTLADGQYLQSSLYTAIIFIIFYQNLWLVEFRIRSRPPAMRTAELNAFLEFWKAHRLNDNIFQLMLSCLEFFSNMVLKPLPMSPHNVTCEHVLGLIYSFLSVTVKSSDPASQLDNVMHLTKRILSISDTLMHKVLGDYLSRSNVGEQQKPIRLFSREPKEIAALATEEVEELFYVTFGSSMSITKKDAEETEQLSQIDVGVDFKILLDEIVKADASMMKFLSEGELQMVLTKLSEMARQLLHGPVAAASQSGSLSQIISIDNTSTVEFFIALTNAPGALLQLCKLVPDAEVHGFNSRVGELINLLLSVGPYLSSFLNSRIFWLINEFMTGSIVINESLLLPMLPMPVLQHLENSKSSTEAYLAIVLCKSLMTRLYISIEFQKDDPNTDISSLLSNIQPSVMISSLATMLARVPSDATFHADLFELLTSSLEVCSFIDPVSTNQCLEMLLRSIVQGWEAQAPEYAIFGDYYRQNDTIHPSLLTTSNILATVTTICISASIPLSHAFFCYVCSLVEHIFCFLHPLLEFAYSNLLTTAVSALSAVYSSKSIYHQEDVVKQAITRRLLATIVEFVLQYDEEFDLLPECLPLFITMTNYLGVVGDKEVISFIQSSFTLQLTASPDYLFTSRLLSGAYFAGLLTNFLTLSSGTDSSLTLPPDSYVAIVDTAMSSFFNIAVSSRQGYSTIEQHIGALLYMSLAAAALLVTTTHSLVYFEKYSSQKMAALFYVLPRTLVPEVPSCDLATSTSTLVRSLLVGITSIPKGQEFLTGGVYGQSLGLSARLLTTPEGDASAAKLAPSRDQVWSSILQAGFLAAPEEDPCAGADTFSLFVEAMDQIVSDSFVYAEAILQVRLIGVALERAGE
ncbi:Hypothetical protein GLP15_5005 [Giardia lamblia P15]|uniref:Uncharacterized protein n=1 Tax=Giardia intestinalis (strain P15) TaxID=658858 RepID=E1EVL8_GIAIA|nr:Hypothetical protein GLP15_5005 [Giardia lamblia P15]